MSPMIRPPWMTCHKKKCKKKREAAAAPKVAAATSPVLDAVFDTYDRRMADLGEPKDPTCPCVVTTALLRDLGVPDVDADVRAHLLGEQTKLWPILLRLADRRSASGDYEGGRQIRAKVFRFERDHDTMRAEFLDKGQPVPAAMMKAHGAAEDILVAELQHEIRREAGLSEAA